ncbi:hypothetical protein V6768_08055 [Tistrella mobilis]
MAVEHPLHLSRRIRPPMAEAERRTRRLVFGPQPVGDPDQVAQPVDRGLLGFRIEQQADLDWFWQVVVGHLSVSPLRMSVPPIPSLPGCG